MCVRHTALRTGVNLWCEWCLLGFRRGFCLSRFILQSYLRVNGVNKVPPSVQRSLNVSSRVVYSSGWKTKSLIAWLVVAFFEVFIISIGVVGVAWQLMISGVWECLRTKNTLQNSTQATWAAPLSHMCLVLCLFMLFIVVWDCFIQFQIQQL